MKLGENDLMMQLMTAVHRPARNMGRLPPTSASVVNNMEDTNAPTSYTVIVTSGRDPLLQTKSHWNKIEQIYYILFSKVENYIGLLTGLS